MGLVPNRHQCRSVFPALPHHGAALCDDGEVRDGLGVSPLAQAVVAHAGARALQGREDDFGVGGDELGVGAFLGSHAGG